MPMPGMPLNFNYTLEAFPMSQLDPKYLYRKLCMSTFQNILNFCIWSSFSLSKVNSPNTTQRAMPRAKRG